MIFTQNLRLKPLLWSQEIANYPTLGEARTTLHVTCKPDSSEILLSNRAELRDYEIPLIIIEGELPADEYQKANFASDALGGLWFLEDDDYVHGWFYLKSKNFVAVWDQIRDGGYDGCQIDLGVQPIKDGVWIGNPLSIVSTSLRFDRKPIDKSADQQAPRESLFARR